MTSGFMAYVLRIAIGACLVGLAGCGKSVSTKNLIGEWRCESENPNSGTAREIWEFKENGIYVIRENTNGTQTYMNGNYAIDGNKIDQTLVTVAAGNYRGVKNTGKIEATLTVMELKEKLLKFESVVLKSGNKRKVTCLR